MTTSITTLRKFPAGNFWIVGDSLEVSAWSESAPGVRLPSLQLPDRDCANTVGEKFPTGNFTICEADHGKIEA
jgi:hypothetical protein